MKNCVISKESYHKKAFIHFMEDDLYLKYKNQSSKNWQTILYDDKFLTSNWYLEERRWAFVISANLFRFDEDTEKIIMISIKL